MEKEQAIKHILTLANAYKSILHWQITARVALGSLYLDARISDETRNEISKLIESQQLLAFDYLVKAR